uniref:Uncharacterized protein n=1 Tax=Calcidiscus leptoporus TaxID=127549 RepID=A0A7S0P484_9EUKA
MLNFANWCRGASGQLQRSTLGHARCQAMLFNRSAARANLRATVVPEPWDALLQRLAAHYGHVAVSVFDGLQPLAARGVIDAVDFTHDGKHPVYWPQGTERGAIYTTYVVDMLAFAISPALITPTDRLWTGGFSRHVSPAPSPPPPFEGWAAAALTKGGLRRLLSGSPRMAALLTRNASAKARESVGGAGAAPLFAHAPSTLPPLLSPTADQLHGVRCYGWGARRQGRWGQIISERSPSTRAAAAKRGGGGGRRLPAWSPTNQEFAFDSRAGEWLPTGVHGKPGLTSVSVGDAVRLSIDSTLGDPAATAVLQLTYLQSYEQMGVLRVSCLQGCTCAPLTLDALLPAQTLATLNTTMLTLTQSRACRVRLANVARGPPDGCPAKVPPEPCEKLKIVAASVSSIGRATEAEIQEATRSIRAGSTERSTEVNTAIGLDFL